MMNSGHIFIKACRRDQTERTPVWIMRQAGRYLPEYMKIRAKHDFMKMCKTPELTAKVTIQPVDIIGVDAAILLSDILVVFTGTEVTNFKTARTSDTKLFSDYFLGMLERGIYLPPSQFEACFVSSAHSKDDIKDTLRSAYKVLKHIKEARQGSDINQKET